MSTSSSQHPAQYSAPMGEPAHKNKNKTTKMNKKKQVTSLNVEVTLDLFVINNIGTAGQVLARYQYV